MQFEYFDIHSHIYFPDFDADREEEIQKLKDAKIAAITIGTDFDSSEKAMALAEKHENLFATVGEHPGDVTLESLFDTRLENLATHNKVLAIGECGLDYFRPSESFEEIKSIQKKIFQSHIDLALKVGKPLMLHIRPAKGSQDAYGDALEMLEAQKKISGEALRGNVHFFVGDLETHPDVFHSHVTMSETDAPFVAPMPYRGQRNSPLYVPEVVKKIAEIRGEDLEVVKTALRDNALRYFLS